MSADNRPSARGRVVLLDDSVVYEWPMGLGLVLIVRWRENDDLTMRIATEQEVAALVAGRKASPPMGA